MHTHGISESKEPDLTSGIWKKKNINKVKFGLNWSKNFSADWATLLTNMEETHPCSFRHKEEFEYDNLHQETACQKS